jgi:hypothetical protein
MIKRIEPKTWHSWAKSKVVGRTNPEDNGAVLSETSFEGTQWWVGPAISVFDSCLNSHGEGILFWVGPYTFEFANVGVCSHLGHKWTCDGFCDVSSQVRSYRTLPGPLCLNSWQWLLEGGATKKHPGLEGQKLQVSGNGFVRILGTQRITMAAEPAWISGTQF